MLDIFHALKYVGDGAKLLFGEGTPESKTHADRGRELLLSDGYAGIETWVGEMRGSEPKGGDGASLSGVLNDLKDHEGRLNYALRLKRGQSIGTGMVEGAAKNLIGRRLKANGARWRIMKGSKGSSPKLWEASWIKSQSATVSRSMGMECSKQASSGGTFNPKMSAALRA